MRLYNVKSRTPMTTQVNKKSQQSVNFLPKQKNDDHYWTDNNYRQKLRSTKSTLLLHGLEAGKTKPKGSSQHSGFPNTSSIAAKITPDDEHLDTVTSIPSSVETPKGMIYDTLSTLCQDLGAEANKITEVNKTDVVLMSQSDENLLATPSTLTKYNIDDIPIAKGIDLHPTEVQPSTNQYLQSIPFSNNQGDRYSLTTKNSNRTAQVKVQHYDTLLHDAALSSNTTAYSLPSKVSVGKSILQKKEGDYSIIRENLRKVYTSRGALKDFIFPTQEAQKKRIKEINPILSEMGLDVSQLIANFSHFDPVVNTVSPVASAIDSSFDIDEPFKFESSKSTPCFSSIPRPKEISSIRDAQKSSEEHSYSQYTDTQLNQLSTSKRPVVFQLSASETHRVFSQEDESRCTKYSPMLKMELFKDDTTHDVSRGDSYDLSSIVIRKDQADSSKITYDNPSESVAQNWILNNSDNENQQQDVVCHSFQDNPKYSNYAQMIKIGIPIQNVLLTDGHDPLLLDCKVPEKKTSSDRHFRIQWEARGITATHLDTIWTMVKHDPDVTNFVVDEAEIKKLFHSKIMSQLKPYSVLTTKENEHVVRVIDSKRANNGGITLARIKLSYSEIAGAIKNFDQNAMSTEQIRGIINFIPTNKEKTALRDYLVKNDSTTLCECEKFMVVMLGIKHAKRKLSVIQFMQSFPSLVEKLRQDARLVQKACDEIISSARFRKVLGIILSLWNRLNGDKKPAKAITTHLLLKLHQVKASFDRKRTFLQFVVRSIRRYRASLVLFKEDMPSLQKVEKTQWSMVLSELDRLEKGLDEVRKISLQHSSKSDVINKTLPLAREVQLLQATSVGRFTLDACLRVAVLVDEIDKAREKFDLLFQYFEEKAALHPDEIFSTICEFERNFDSALNEVIHQDSCKVCPEKNNCGHYVFTSRISPIMMYKK